MNKFEKQRIALRYWLLGAQYFSALDAMQFAASHHTGLRKDGVTPEFEHQISIVHYLRTLLPHMMYPERTIIVGFTHDTVEDMKDVTNEMLASRFGSEAAHSVRCVTKKEAGTGAVYDEVTLFEMMAEDACASLVKPADGIHNFDSMVGVFTREKQERKIERVEKLFFPMLKKARRNFPKQEGAYENAKHVLKSQIDMLRAIHATEDRKAA